MWNLCVLTCIILYFLTVQEQYIFIHDAVLEYITCGDTSIEAPNVMRAMAKLKTKDKMTGLNGYEQELKVSVEKNDSYLCTNTLYVDTEQSQSQS